MSNLMYKKRDGTSGIRGHLYETKFLSLILFRALKDPEIETFYIGTNVDGLGEFDDVCFRFKMKGVDKPVAVFIQAKHRDDLNKHLAVNSIDLPNLLKSYMKIRNKFDAKKKNHDAFFEGTYSGVECVFIYYTNTKDDLLGKHFKEHNFIKKINDIIGTGDVGGFYIKHTDEDVTLLHKILCREKIKKFASIVANIVKKNGKNYEVIMNDELIYRYHVILAQRVFDITEIQQRVIENNKGFERHRIGRFKADFLETNDENLLILRDSLTKEIEMNVLKSAEFKLPPEFGNIDITLKHAKKEARLNRLSEIIVELLNKSKECVINEETFHIVNIDENFSDKGFLKTIGGIASAVGNLLIFDETTKLLMFARGGNLEGHAKSLFDNINSQEFNVELEKYRFYIDIEHFPRLSFDCSKKERNSILDFTNKLLYYTNQDSQNEIEDTLKNEIDERLPFEQGNFQIRSDFIFKVYHDMVQKWWMKQEDAQYLTETTDLFQNATNNVITSLSMANVLSKDRLLINDIELDSQVVNKFDKSRSKTTIIVSDVVALSVKKVTQRFKDNEYILLDLNYILNLPKNDRRQLKDEMKKKQDTVFILVTNLHEHKIKDILQALKEQRLIIVTDNGSFGKIGEQFATTGIDIISDKISLVDLTKESQDFIRRGPNFIFQGEVVSLNMMFDNEDPNLSKIIKGEHINKIRKGDNIQIGKPLCDSKYDEIKDSYVSRKVVKIQSADPPIHLQTFYDIEEKAVLIAAKLGMGKSTLLTHLSLTTKARDPGVWIVRINLLDYSRYFSNWKKKEIVIDLLEALTFICNVLFNQNGDEKIKLTEDNDDIFLSDCANLSEEVQFEICMFLHCCKRRRVIFLFDGFDEIYPDYTNEVMKLLKVFEGPRGYRMWVTCRMCYDALDSLNKVFSDYRFVKWSLEEQVTVFATFMRSEINFSNLSPEKLEKIDKFMHNMLGIWGKYGSVLEYVYYVAGLFFKQEITRIPDNFKDKEEYIKAWDAFVAVMREKFVDTRDMNPNNMGVILHENGSTIILYDNEGEKNNIILSMMLEVIEKTNEDVPIATDLCVAEKGKPFNNTILGEDTYWKEKSLIWDENTMTLILNDNTGENTNELTIIYKETSNINEHVPLVKPLNMIEFLQNTKKDEPMEIPLLIMRIAAENLANEINSSETVPKWNHGSSLYERFFTRKFEIQFEEKNKVDRHIPHNKHIFDKGRREFLIKHKQLAAYVTFTLKNRPVKLFNEAELDEIKHTIDSIQKGEYKSELITMVVDDVPRFIHKTIAEYLALEYVHDLHVAGRCGEFISACKCLYDIYEMGDELFGCNEFINKIRNCEKEDCAICRKYLSDVVGNLLGRVVFGENVNLLVGTITAVVVLLGQIVQYLSDKQMVTPCQGQESRSRLDASLRAAAAKMAAAIASVKTSTAAPAATADPSVPATNKM